MTNIHCVVVGAGGVGGWLGGALLESNFEVTLIARGQHGSTIKKNGITLMEGTHISTFNPTHVHENATALTKKADVIFLATKLGDMQNACHSLTSCLTKDSIIIPLQNGIDAHEMVMECLPHHRHRVGWGTVHIVSLIKEAGVIQRKSDFARFFIQAPKGAQKFAQEFIAQCSTDKISLRHMDDLTQLLWDKFIFLTAYSGVTSYSQKNLGGIRENKQLWQMLKDALAESEAVAAAMGISLSKSPRAEWLKRLELMPADYDSSMAQDMRLGKPLELAWLSGRIVQLGKQFHVATPAHDLIVAKLAPLAKGA